MESQEYVYNLWADSICGISGTRRAYYASFFLYSSPPRSLSLAAACSGVMSLCGSASISYPTRNLRTVADRKRGG